MGRIVIIGGGPAGYEAALVAAQLGAEVTVIEAEGAGGACVLHDCVPSKTFIASSSVVTAYLDTEEFGVRSAGGRRDRSTRRRCTGGSSGWPRRSPATSTPSCSRRAWSASPGTARLGEDTLGHTHAVIDHPGRW